MSARGRQSVTAPGTAVLAAVSALALASCGGSRATEPAGDGPAPETPVDVQVARVAREDIVHRIVLPTSVEAYETATLYSKVSGYLASIEVDIGDRVSRGQVLAKIEIPEILDRLRETEAELSAARADVVAWGAQLEKARADFGLLETTYGRLRAVREEEPDLMSPQTVDEARARFEAARAEVKLSESRVSQAEGQVRRVEASLDRTRTLIDFSRIRAPIEGVVTERFVDPGALLQAATASRAVQPVVTVADVDRLRVYVDVPESEVPFVQTGDPATVTADALPGERFEGRVTRYATAVDPATRTMRTEIGLSGPGRGLRPGMYGHATLELETRSDAVIVPAGGIRVQGEEEYVFAVLDRRAVRIDVVTEIGDGITAEVTDGLEGGETIVVSARSPLRDGVAVNSAADGLGGGGRP